MMHFLLPALSVLEGRNVDIAWDRKFYYSYVRCLDLLVENKLSAHELTKGAVLSLDEFFV